MKSRFYHVFIILIYLLVMAAGWYFYDRHGRAMLERMEYRSDASSPGLKPGQPRPMSQMLTESQDYIQNTIKVTTIKIFILIAFAAIAIALLGHVAFASSAGSLRKLSRYLNAVHKGKDPSRYKLKKGDRYYPLFLQVEALTKELAQKREIAAQASENEEKA